MIRQTVVSTKGPRAWQGIPAIERAPNGRLWCAFYSGGPKEPDPANLILLTTSEDDGRTWATPEPIVVYLSDAADDTTFSRSIELDSRGNVSYPDAVEATDGYVYTVHDHDRYGDGEILLSCFSIDRLLAGQATRAERRTTDAALWAEHRKDEGER